MSFILDALKKSESDRQRQSGPALFEVKVAPPKSRFPVWAIAIAALLVINMIIVGWMLLRRASRSDDTTAANTPPAATTPAPGTAAPPAASPPLAAAAPQTAPPLNGAPYNGPPYNSAPSNGTPPNGTPPNSASYSSAPYNGGSPTGAYPGSPQPAYPQSGNPPPNNMSAGNMPSANEPAANTPAPSQWQPGAQQSTGTTQSRMSQRDQNEPTLARNGNARDAASGDTDPAANPDDYAPATEGGSSLFKGHVRRGTESGLMLYQDIALVQGSNLPQLRLDLHVYAVKPQDRFALINMHKMHEGDSLQGGVRVEAITPDGVVMSHNGSKFLLPRE
ncbi:MAG: general secretion pathway protein GspB [Steroidobacteraceae bacterium]